MHHIIELNPSLSLLQTILNFMCFAKFYRDMLTVWFYKTFLSKYFVQNLYPKDNVPKFPFKDFKTKL